MAKITVQNTEVNVVKLNGKDYICLKNMLHPDFNYGEFATISYQTLPNCHPSDERVGEWR